MVTRPPVPGFDGAATTVSATAFADSADQARELLRVSHAETSLVELGAEVERETPKGQRYVWDNIWTRAPSIAPLIQRAADTMPNPECQVVWYWLGRPGRRTRPGRPRRPCTSRSTESAQTPPWTARRPVGRRLDRRGGAPVGWHPVRGRQPRRAIRLPAAADPAGQDDQAQGAA